MGHGVSPGKPYVKVISGALQDRLKILAKAAGDKELNYFLWRR